jgi:hypothetical protein
MISPSADEVVEFFRLDERAAADLNERQFAFLDQRVERGGADAAQLLSGLVDRHEVPHMFLVAPRALVKIFLWHLGTFNYTCRRRWWWALPPDSFLHGLVDKVAERLGEPVGGVTHRCCL